MVTKRIYAVLLYNIVVPDVEAETPKDALLCVLNNWHRLWLIPEVPTGIYELSDDMLEEPLAIVQTEDEAWLFRWNCN